MKKDLEQLIKANNINALWVSGAAQHNPSMTYFTGAVHVTGADLFIIPGRKPILFHGMMEREEAAKTGYELISYALYPLSEYLKQTDNNQLAANALRYKKMLEDIGLTKGNVLLYGNREIGPFYSLIREVEDLLPGIRFMGDYDDTIILEARATKDPAEIEEIRKMGEITVGVVRRVEEFLSNHKVVDETLIKEDGTALTIGDVKSLINLWLAEAGAENPEATIFAIGRDGGIPHSSGTPSDPLKLGKSIVFDIFPCQAGGGYFYDFTRTWCLGYAPEEVQHAYEQVRQVYHQVANELKLGEQASKYQDLTCELFEEMGHETIRQNATVEEGYIHSVGHGLGLNVHEKPWLGRQPDPNNILRIGSVFTLEPGLYYPSKGYGIRIEDTWYVTEDGRFEKFVDYPMELVIPMKGG
ncbi:MAG: M24 family metallopeptidase [Anaerolineaceae bacterium]|jgi:Xaa-Pro aminopeptidase|nr:M24 family metallopeptidase [Anaerolineaceae bacterium]MDD4043718.1 M24 family metallopeptidase [Anaerolineaceae bacterium]MDD4578406.1 M24 family metallopeptidase [Anaerolineaceae bacterium]